MSRPLSITARRAAYAQQSKEAWVALLTISHPNIPTMYVCDDATELLPIAGVRGIVSRGQEFVFMPFALTLPNSDDTGVSKAKLNIDNTDRRIVQAAREADSALLIKIEVVLASRPDDLEMEIDGFRIENVPYDAFTVSGELTQEYYDLEPFPWQHFTPSTTPGLF